MSVCEAYYTTFTGKPRDKDEKRKTFMSVRDLENHLMKEANKFSKKREDHKNAIDPTPNFLSILPRKAFSLLNRICSEMVECDDSIGFAPQKKGCAAKFEKKLKTNSKSAEGKFLSEAIAKMKRLNSGIPRDCFYHELLCSVLAIHHSQPPRIQTIAEPVLVEFLEKEVYRSSKSLKDNVKLFPVEGTCSALVNILNTLKYNGLLIPGDDIGIVTPISSSYLEMPVLRNYGLTSVCIESDPENGSKIPVDELNKISDSRMKALLLMDPSDVTGQALSAETIQNLQKLIRKDNPELIVITVSSYAPFAEKFNSVWDNLSRNSIGVFGFSEYFGASGWNLACIITHNNNLMDKKLLKEAPEEVNSRYVLATNSPDRLKLMDRIVMDSRQVVGYDAAGLGTASQILMCLFAAQEITDKSGAYAKNIKILLAERVYSLGQGLEHPVESDELSTDCFKLINLVELANSRAGGCEFGDYLKESSSCLEFCEKLAKSYGVEVLPGMAVGAPEWSLRFAVTALDDKDVRSAGESINDLLEEYYEKFVAWKEKKKKEEVKEEKKKAGI